MARIKRNLHILITYLFISELFLTHSGNRPDALWRRIIEDSYKYSPYNSFCNRSVTPVELPEYSRLCVLPCSCETETCGDKLTCCPDISQKPTGTSNSSCVYPVIHSESQNQFSRPYNHVKYPLRMIHDCAPEYIGSDLHKKCLLYRNTSNLDNLTPVMSNSTGIIYVNRFCAECSKIMYFEAFKPSFVCWYELFSPKNWDQLTVEWTLENQYRLTQAGLCVYVFRMPNEVKLEENECSNPTYTSCNQTGESDIMDPFLTEACEAYELPYNYLYRNIHCFLCNTRSSQRLSEQVYEKLNTYCPVKFRIQNILEISFYAIIDIEQFQTSDRPSSGNKQCEDIPANMHDRYLDKCRNVSCPVFNIRQGNECVTVYSGFEKIPKEVVIMFKEVNESFNLADPYINIPKDVFLSIIIKHVVSTVIDAEEMCRLSLFRQKTISHYPTDFILRIGWRSSSAEELVPQTVQKLFHSQYISLDIKNTSGVFEAKLLTNWKSVYDYMIVTNISYTYWFSKYFSRNKSCRTVLQISKLLICKRITLLVSELNDTDDVLQPDSVFSLPMEYRVSGDYISVCLDDYLNYIESKIKSNPSDPENAIDRVVIMLSFLCSIMSIVSLCITVFTYLVFKILLTVPGKINICLCISLMLAQILQTITIDLTDYHIVCVICGVLIHFCWLATLLWMNVASFYLFHCFCLSAMSRSFSHSESRLWLYSIYVLVFSSLLIGMNVVYSLLVSDGRSIGYGKDLCYISSVYGLLYTFIIPAGGIVLTNCCFLFVAIYWISRRPKIDQANMPNRNNILIYLKMSTLTGICWLFGFLRILIKSDTFEVLFILTNGLQGMMLMLSFVCNKRVLGLYKELMHRNTN